jgi:hypothetical protein
MAWVLLLSAPALAAGPISKFESKEPTAQYVTAAKMEDVERCLSDLDGWLAPNIYKQDDRPNHVTVLWIAGGAGAGLAKARVDLDRAGNGTQIKSWLPSSQVQTCAPR